MAIIPEDLQLEARRGLPDDLRYLVAKYPREVWQDHANLGQTAQFWLQRHDMFRELGVSLGGAASDYREGQLQPLDFARWFAPRIRFYLMQLDGHHQVEDMHYFPIFAAAERKLQRGFDILDNDHHVIHDAIELNRDTAQQFLITLQQQDTDKQRYAADAYANENDRLIHMLTRHLADEEDLIVPLMLDRTEEGLGIAQ